MRRRRARHSAGNRRTASATWSKRWSLPTSPPSPPSSVALKVGKVTWTGSVPLRGSGWVRSLLDPSAFLVLSAFGAEYDSQGQARREAERVAPGKENKRRPALKGRNNRGSYFGL